MEAYLGIDVGSVSTKFAVLNGADDLIASLYLPTGGQAGSDGAAGTGANRKAVAARR